MEFIFEAQSRAMLSGKLFDKPGANVMTRFGVFSAWVAKSNNEFDVSQSLFLALCLGTAFGFRGFCRFTSGSQLFFLTFDTWVVDAGHNGVMALVHFKR